MSVLFTPWSVRGAHLRNRIGVAPMCQYRCEAEDGRATEWHLVHLGSFAIGGAGLVITEAAAVSPEGRLAVQDLGIWNDDQRDALVPVTAFLREQGAVAGIQLAHAGRKGSVHREWDGVRGTRSGDRGGWTTVAPSALAFAGYAPPVALAEDEIAHIVADFAAAARRSVEAGFGVVEIHAAHGYLLHQFLSPLSNTREDRYGGSLQNRARLLLEVVRAVRTTIGDETALFVRFSATDWAEGGWDLEQTVQVAGWAADAGADVFDLSSGGLVAHQQIEVAPLYQVPFAREVKRATGAAVAAVGLITTPVEADAVLADGEVDIVLVGREMLRDPHFALRAARESGEPIEYWPQPYERARRRTRS